MCQRIAKTFLLAAWTLARVYRNQNYSGRTVERAKTIVNLLWWMIHEGQEYTKPLDYAPLPEAAAKKAENNIKSITYGNNPVMP